jgi:hypothetical protein
METVTLVSKSPDSTPMRVLPYRCANRKNVLSPAEKGTTKAPRSWSAGWYLAPSASMRSANSQMW